MTETWPCLNLEIQLLSTVSCRVLLVLTFLLSVPTEWLHDMTYLLSSGKQMSLGSAFSLCLDTGHHCYLILSTQCVYMSTCYYSDKSLFPFALQRTYSLRVCRPLTRAFVQTPIAGHLVLAPQM